MPLTKKKPHPQEADYPYMQIADLASHCADVSIVKIRKATELLNVGDTLIVERCGACAKCTPDMHILVCENGTYVIRRQRDIEPQRHLRVVGSKSASTVIIGRVLGWVSKCC
jgi:hypothetical protein